MNDTQQLAVIKNYISQQCIFRCDPNKQYGKDLPLGRLYGKGAGTFNRYLFVLSRLTNPRIFALTSQRLYQRILDVATEQAVPRVQIAGLQNAAINWVAALSYLEGARSIHTQPFITSAFTVRKQRKSYGLMQYIDGVPNNDPVVLIDDLINSGSTIYQAADVIERELQLPLFNKCFCIVKLNPDSTFPIQTNKHKLEIDSLFTSNDFALQYQADLPYWEPADISRTENKRPEYF